MTTHSHTCLKRWFRQVLFIPFLHSSWLTKDSKSRLSSKVSQAENGHRGEIMLIIENHLPIHEAYHHGSRKRAIDLFSEYRVWDTEENTGVLVYVNICEHSLDIIADRGINQQVELSAWQAMCDKATTGIKQKKTEESLEQLLTDIGLVLNEYYQLADDQHGNELSDAIVHLK